MCDGITHIEIVFRVSLWFKCLSADHEPQHRICISLSLFLFFSPILVLR